MHTNIQKLARFSDSLNNSKRNNGDTQGYRPLHLSDNDWQVGSHVCFGAKLPAKWQVADHSIYTGAGQRQHCTHRGKQTDQEVI